MSKILRLHDVIALTGLSRSSILRMVDNGRFPRSLRLNERAVGWLQTEVLEWVAAKVADRDAVDVPIVNKQSQTTDCVM